MILDSLKNSALYENVNPRMKKAFALIASTDWTKMEPGIHELDGKDIYVNVMERELKQKSDAKLEVHNEYIDIQVLVTGKEEAFGWSERKDLRIPQGAPCLRVSCANRSRRPCGPGRDVALTTNLKKLKR